MAVELEIADATGELAAVERELRTRAGEDRDRCCGYFTTLDGTSGIVSDLPACRAFAVRLPQLVVLGARATSLPGRAPRGSREVQRAPGVVLVEIAEQAALDIGRPAQVA